MKKVLIIVSSVICVLMIAFLIIADSGSEGIFLKTENGSNIIILDNSPVVMSAKSGNNDIFEKYETGDKILIFHDGIMESYPAQTRVLLCIKISDGEYDDISQNVIESLSELGWMADEE